MLGRRREARSRLVVVRPGAAAERLQDPPAVVVVAVCQLATLAGSEHSALANNPHHSERSSVDVGVLCLDENAQRNFDWLAFVEVPLSCRNCTFGSDRPRECNAR